ncbi:cytochrome c oxidase subunit 3 [Pseudomonas corrugata]|uniref:Cytochrome c oxidase subunit 3 n=1 Tax=Pseudomonas corrugata TaxID=47879 RepID=A0A8B6UXS3_9PSED|nr:cytochrome c oxidase subunit 3 [Pseudomonas corrugata]QTH16700.1 cytochrome c oxidase subunit 3 [Pseudomonas corrugata]
MNRVDGRVSDPFQTDSQQREAAHLGMWLFLATELMMFGGLLFTIWYYRVAYEASVRIAVEHLHYLLGGANSALLLTSSFTMSLAIQAARRAKIVRLKGLVLLSIALATVFLGLKVYEYRSEYIEGLLPVLTSQAPLKAPQARLFMGLYFISTALHAIHIVIAIIVALGIWLRIHLGRLPLPQRISVMETFGFYWHTVDVIWIFLYPSLYLIGRPI